MGGAPAGDTCPHMDTNMHTCGRMHTRRAMRTHAHTQTHDTGRKRGTWGSPQPTVPRAENIGARPEGRGAYGRPDCLRPGPRGRGRQRAAPRKPGGSRPAGCPPRFLPHSPSPAQPRTSRSALCKSQEGRGRPLRGTGRPRSPQSLVQQKQPASVWPPGRRFTREPVSQRHLPGCSSGLCDFSTSSLPDATANTQTPRDRSPSVTSPSVCPSRPPQQRHFRPAPLPRDLAHSRTPPPPHASTHGHATPRTWLFPCKTMACSCVSVHAHAFHA